MKKLLIITMLLLAVTSAYAKDPKETVEYWANRTALTDENIKEMRTEMDKCWDSSMRLYFKVKEGSKQWNTCVAIVAVNRFGGNFEASNTYAKNRKKAETGK